jgi:hypothetical protein
LYFGVPCDILFVKGVNAMSSRRLSLWVHAAALAAGGCALTLLAWIIPSWGGSLVQGLPEYAAWVLPWEIFLWLSALPCFAVLGLMWRVATAIARERVFTAATARWIQSAAVLLFADAGFVLLGSIALALLGMNHPGVMLIVLLVVLLVLVAGVLAAVLSRYILKAAALQEESEGTV